LIAQAPQTALYGTRVAGDRMAVGTDALSAAPEAVTRFRRNVQHAAGLDGAKVLRRSLSTGSTRPPRR